MILDFPGVSEQDHQTWLSLAARQTVPISATWDRQRLRIVLPDLTKQALVLENAGWSDMKAADRIIGERRIYVTFDRGRLELFMPGLDHEYLKYALGAMVDMLCDERDIPSEAGESVTLMSEAAQRRAEADKSFYFGDHAETMRGKSQLTLGIDPPPDLLIEIDLSRSSLNRMEIYAAMGAPEVWLWRRDAVTFHQLQPRGTYAQAAESAAFPGFTAQSATEWVESIHLMNKTHWRRAFRQFIRTIRPPAPE